MSTGARAPKGPPPAAGAGTAQAVPHWRRESDLTRFYGLFPSPALARDLFNIVEGCRIDARIRAAYPGIRRDMDLIQSETLARRQELGPLPEAAAIVEVLLQASLGGEPEVAHLDPGIARAAMRARALLDEVRGAEAGVADSARVTATVYRIIDDELAAGRRGTTKPFADEAERARAEREEQDSGDQEGAEGEVGVTEYDQLELPPFMPPVMEQLVRPQELPQIQAQGQEPTPGAEGEDAQPSADELDELDKAMSTSEAQVGPGDADDVAQRGEASDDEATSGEAEAGESKEEGGTGGETPSGPQAPLPQAEEEPEQDLGEQVFHYDEWDHRIEDYRPNWCTLREQRSTRQLEAFVAATFHEFGGIVTQIRRNFQLMRPERLRKMRFQTEGDDLDVDGLVEYVVDRRARVTPTERVYIQRDKKDRDVTTVFLVDMSSSTDRKIDGRKRIIDIEKEGLILMCEALEAIRDEYAIYGFSGSGRDDCQFYVVKELGERYDDRVRARIGGIYGRQKTRMGPALRHATKRLMSVDANVKLLILLTDGKPYDSDTYQDNTYAQEDTKMALREARREKIHLFCVTVDREAADYLPHMYSDANFVIIDDVRTLPQKLPQLYKRLTT
ncbi:MAG: VWA domain-containing protein [Gammaproteobacteria bacterium]|nr:VWA domain-containing protein [Gammaproteobacteria bacterium]